MLGFLKKFIPFAFIIALVLYLLSFANGFEEVIPFAWICFGLFFVLAIVTFYFSAKTMVQKFSNFMGVFFVSIFAKLILSAIVVMVYKSDHDTTDVNFIIPFAIIYFSFLFFETLELVKLSRKIGNNHPPKNEPVK